jgi:hypothetical protein
MWSKHMLDSSNTPGAVRVEDQPLIKAINDARRRYRFSEVAAQRLLEDFIKPKPPIKRWIFELCDPSPRADPFMTNDVLAALTRDVLTRGRDGSARWADLSPRERRLARRIERFAQNKRRGCMRAGRPQNVDRALLLYVIRRIEEATGVAFRFSRPAALLGSPGGPMLRLAEAALLRLFQIADNDYLGLVSPARHYTRREIARTAEMARARRATSASPANWQSDWILAFPTDVRVELASKVRPENTDQGSALPSSWSVPMEVFEAAFAAGRQTRLIYGSGLEVLQDNLKSGAQPDLIELSKRRSPLV